MEDRVTAREMVTFPLSRYHIYSVGRPQMNNKVQSVLFWWFAVYYRVLEKLESQNI